jgi:hypothetical protein
MFLDLHQTPHTFKYTCPTKETSNKVTPAYVIENNGGGRHTILQTTELVLWAWKKIIEVLDMPKLLI